MECFSVYVLYSPDYVKYYIGQTNSLARRIDEHNTSELNSYTKKCRPWELYFSMEVGSRSAAVKIEKYLKKKPREFIRSLRTSKELVSYIKAKYDP